MSNNITPFQQAEIDLIEDGDIKLSQATLMSKYPENIAQQIMDKLIAKHINAPKCEIITTSID